MRVDVGGGVRLFVEVVGTRVVLRERTFVERPAVVVAHGGPQIDHFSARSYDELADVAQLVYYDHRGIGRSDPGNRDDWNLATWADDLRRLCDALGIDRPIVLGHSLGSFVALEYAIRHAGHARGLVLVTPLLRRDPDRIVEAFARVGGAEARAAAARAFVDPSDEARETFGRICEPLFSRRPIDLETFSSTPPNPELAAHYREHVGPTIDFTDRVADVTVPALLVAGELDPLIPPELAQDLAEELPSARLQVVPDAAHSVERDRPDVVFPLIRDFIAELAGKEAP